MKLLRFGEAGVEKPGIMDTNGTIRDVKRGAILDHRNAA